MRFGSVCSGIEAASVAWEPLGWRASFLSEIDAFPRAVLAHRFPAVPLHGDFTTIEAGQYDAIDVLVGGTPCQDFSVAGKREGVGGERGGLTFEFARLARRLGPGWLVWENVPGVFSLNGGRDFGAVLACFAGYPDGSIFEPPADGWRNAGVVQPAGPDGYGLAWRVLDAQFFGVPQRRRRVFVIGYLGDWRPSAAVLFEREGLRGDPAPRRQAGERAAPTLSARTKGGGGLGTDFDCDGGLVFAPETSPALKARDYKGPSSDGDGDGDGAPLIAHALRGEGFDASEGGTGRGTPLVPFGEPIGFDARQSDVLIYGDKTGPLDTDGHLQAIAFAQNSRDEVRLQAGDGQIVGALSAEPGMKQTTYVAYDLRGREGGAQFEGPHDSANLRASSGGSSRSYVAASAVRRLTPRECERLQGFPDDWTLVPVRGKPAADGPRYKACGNSMAVPVMRWIGERIALVDSILAQVRKDAA